MKILQLGKYHWRHPGGLEKYLGQMYEHYKRPNYDVDVDYVVLQRGFKSHVYKNEHSTVYVLATLGNFYSAPIFYPSAVTNRIAREKYDIIQLHYPNPCMHLLYEFIRRKNPSAKLVLFWHSDILRQRFLKKLYKPFQEKLLSSAHKIFVTSPNYRDSSDDLAMVREKCELLPFGYRRVVKSPNFPNGKSILSVGRFVQYKGFEYLIKAMADPSMKDYNLKLVGGGREYNKLQKLIHRNKLSDRVTIINNVSDDDLVKYYSDCSVFVLPSVNRAEAFGMVLLEAMAHGKPVITTAIGTGTDYIVKDGLNGRVVGPYSAEALRSALRDIAENDEKMKKMGEASLARIETMFNVDNHFRTVHKAYKSLLNL